MNVDWTKEGTSASATRKEKRVCDKTSLERSGLSLGGDDEQNLYVPLFERTASINLRYSSVLGLSRSTLSSRASTGSGS